MEYKIAVISGDGIGVDVIREAVRSLDKIGEVYGHQFHKVERLVGWNPPPPSPGARRWISPSVPSSSSARTTAWWRRASARRTRA